MKRESRQTACPWENLEPDERVARIEALIQSIIMRRSNLEKQGSWTSVRGAPLLTVRDISPAERESPNFGNTVSRDRPHREYCFAGAACIPVSNARCYI